MGGVGVNFCEGGTGRWRWWSVRLDDDTVIRFEIGSGDGFRTANWLVTMAATEGNFEIIWAGPWIAV